MDTNPLDNPAYAALSGPHAHVAERRGRALRYPADVNPIAALPLDPTQQDWADACELVGPGGSLFLPVVPVNPPPDWHVRLSMPGVQMVAEHMLDLESDEEAAELGASDVLDMLDLVGRTRPGPFAERTIELGTYLGIRRHGRLVAMGGERLLVPGWTEISAVCSDPQFRGQGLAGSLIILLCNRIRARGRTPFLHVASDNTNAIRLYENLGFVVRSEVMFTLLMAPK